MTKVIFRVWKDTGDVIALFPDEAFNARGGIMSYMHVGQHGEADYAHVIAATRRAKYEEYAPLSAELDKLGYTLRPVTRR